MRTSEAYTGVEMSDTSKVATRNWGIDLLRLVSMRFVVILHMLRHNGFLKLPTDTSQYAAAWFLEIMAMCAVDIFAIVSGYVTYRDTPRKFKLSSYLNLWLQVTFYTVLFMIIGHLVYPDVLPAKRILLSFFPVSTNQYWYFTAYTALFFIMPILDAGVRNISVQSARRIFLAFLVAFMIVPQFADSIGIGTGYNFAWLAILYMVGGIMKKANIGANVKAPVSALMIIVPTTVTWLLKINGILGTPQYAAVPVFLSAIFWILLVSRLNFGATWVRFIKWAAPTSFAIYILNMHPAVMYTIYNPLSISEFTKSSPAIVVLVVIGASLAFVAAAILIDRVRIRLFNLLHVPQGLATFESVAERVTTSLSSRFSPREEKTIRRGEERSDEAQQGTKSL
ncbi:MAG: acyltransferase [Actinomycetaceae bacterium]|nr:acyltransferase [Actinomycetaceae bacterium]